MAGPLGKYAYINAKLRARISQILPDERLQQIAKAANLDAALALLRETPFAALEGIYSTTGDLKQTELELLRAEIALYADIRRYLHKNTQPIVDSLLARFEIENLKNAIRVYFDSNLRGRSVEGRIHYVLYERILHDLPLDHIVHAHDFEAIAGFCQHTPYSAIIRMNYPKVEEDGSLFCLEVAFDHYYYQTLLEAIAKLDKRDRAQAMRLIGVEIDLQNISWLMRLKKFYELPLETVRNTLIPGGYQLKRPVVDELYRTQDVTSVLQGIVAGQYPGLATLLGSRSSDRIARLQMIERILDEIRRQEVQRILSGYPFTIGIVLAYFILKGRELARIRTLLNAKVYGRSTQRIESER